MQNGVSFFSAVLVYTNKLGVVKLLSVPKMGQMSKSGTFPECHMFKLRGCFVIPLYVKSSAIIFKKMLETNVGGTQA